MVRLKPEGIRERFTMILASVITLAVLCFSAVSMFYTSKSEEADLNHRVTKLLDFSKKSLSTALWQYNFDYVKKYVDSLLLYEDIVFTSVLVKGETIEKAVHDNHRALSFKAAADSRDFIAIETMIRYRDTDVGTLRLVASRERIRDQIISHSLVLVSVLLIINLVVFWANFFMINQYLFRPLLKLENSVEAVSAGDLNARIDTGGKDEIGHLAASFYQMLENLKRITASRDDLNYEIKERKRAEKRIEGLNRLKEELIGPGSLEIKLATITASVVELMKADFSRIWLMESGDLCDSDCRHGRRGNDSFRCVDFENCLHLVASSGRYTHTGGRQKRIPIGFYKIGEIAVSNTFGFISNDLMADDRIRDKAWVDQLQLKSFAGYNLNTSDGQSVGVLALFSRNVITDQEDAFLRTIAGTAAQVVQVSRSQQMLAQSEKKYRNFFGNAQIGLFRSRIRDGKIVESNDRMAEIFGYKSPEECVQNYVGQNHYLYPAQRKEVVRALDEKGEIVNYQTQIRINSGSVKWIQFSGIVMPDDPEYFEGVAADITEQRQAEDEVISSLREKEVLLREVHHRVKNNMQIIQSLLNLQSNEIKDEKYKRLLIDSNNRIKSMSLIHETLYRSKDIAQLDLKTYFDQIARHLLQIYRLPGLDVDLDLAVAPVQIDLDRGIACGLILNELVSNSLKYAFESMKKGTIGIGLRSEGPQTAVLSVSDNGCGFNTADYLGTGESLGLKIVDILVRGQLNGRIDISDRDGTCYDIRFPLKNLTAKREQS